MNVLEVDVVGEIDEVVDFVVDEVDELADVNSFINFQLFYLKKTTNNFVKSDHITNHQ
jgi:hypothetical protein